MRYLLVIALINFFTSCVKENSNSTINPVTFNGDFSADLYLEPGDTTLYLLVNSRGKYNSYCKHVEGEMIKDQTHFNLNFMELN